VLKYIINVVPFKKKWICVRMAVIEQQQSCFHDYYHAGEILWKVIFVNCKVTIKIHGNLATHHEK